MSVLHLENVEKTIGRRRIVNRIQMTVNQGEVYGFLGPNGAGKTTTIRMIVGLIKATSGKIYIDGSDIQTNRARALSQIGCIVENPEFYNYMSGRKNLYHFGMMSKVPNLRSRIDEVAELVKLRSRLDDAVKTYSLGMRQRLGIAQAILAHPKLLILDEPTNGLDPKGIAEFRETIRLLSNQGMSVFVSSHLLSEVEQVANRIGIIKEGTMITERDMSSLSSNVEQTYLISLDRLSEAIAFLQRNKLSVTQVSQNQMEIQVPDGVIDRVIKALISEGFMITEFTKKKQSLEEEFLKIVEEL